MLLATRQIVFILHLNNEISMTHTFIMQLNHDVIILFE